MGGPTRRETVPQLTIDQYAVRERIRAAGLGLVWRVDQRTIARQAPVHLVRPDLDELPRLLSRLRESVRAASDPAHPSAIATIDLGVGDAPPLLLMEHVDGIPLAEAQAAPFSMARTLHVVAQILRALEQAHAAGIVHADLRPEHVVLGASDAVTLIDVDVVSDDDDAYIGAAYLAPEVIAGGTPTVASDLYAVGVILYRLLTGTLPFDGASIVEVMTRQLHDRVVPPSIRRRDLSIPPGVELAAVRALAHDPGARFADAATFAVQLELAMRVVPAVVDVDALWDTPPRSARLMTRQEAARALQTAPGRLKASG